MNRIGVVFFALLVGAWGQTTQISQCVVSSGPLPLNAYVAGCTIPPCRLAQEENAVINVIFRAPRFMRSMTTLANAFLIGNFPIPYPLRENAVTCNFLNNSYCPVLEGEILNYTLNMFIEDWMTEGIAPTIEFRIQDDNSQTIMCLRVPIVIIAPNARSLDARNSTASINASN